MGPMTPMNEANMLRKIEQDAVEQQEQKRKTQEEKQAREKKEDIRWRINEVRAWITVAIALAAFVKSFFF